MKRQSAWTQARDARRQSVGLLRRAPTPAGASNSLGRSVDAKVPLRGEPSGSRPVDGRCLGQGAAGINPSFIADHEELHIWQSRFFGPLFQATYIVWAVGGFLVATVVWFTDTDEDWGSLVETAAYYDNPFETWAYKNHSNWPPGGANAKLTWA